MDGWKIVYFCFSSNFHTKIFDGRSTCKETNLFERVLKETMYETSSFD